MRWLAVLFTVALTGCSGNLSYTGEDPAFRGMLCSAGEKGSGMIVLIAQSVPDIPAVPCLRSAPGEWTVQAFEPEDGRTHVQFTGVNDSTRFDADVVGRCDHSDARESAGVPRPAGMRRYDGERTTGGRYQAHRYYVADGGCVAFHFDGAGRHADQTAEDIMTAFDFLTRAEIDRGLAKDTGGRLHLDPEP